MKMKTRRKVPAGTVLTDTFPFSRAVRIGDIVEVAGSGSYEGDTLVGGGNMYEQARFIYAKIERILAEVDVTLEDVAKVTIYTTDISRWPEVARAHKEYFAGIEPATTMVEVSALIEPEMLVEIEATAVLTPS